MADGKGLRIEGLRETSKIRLMQGYRMADFAPWLYFKDKWTIPGDFSIRTDPEKYRKYFKLSATLKEKLKVLDAGSRSFDKKKKLEYQRLRKFALHNPEDGLSRLTSFLNLN